jgi:hypothetical protein
MANMSRTELAPRLLQIMNQELQRNIQMEQAILESKNAEQEKAVILSQTLTELADLDRRITYTL